MKILLIVACVLTGIGILTCILGVIDVVMENKKK